MNWKLRKSIALLVVPALASLPAYGQESNSEGRILFVHGRVEIVSNEVSRAAQRGDNVAGTDRIITYAASSAQIRFSDGSLLALRPDTELIIAEYRYQPGGSDNAQETDLVRGSLRAVSGALGRATP